MRYNPDTGRLEYVDYDSRIKEYRKIKDKLKKAILKDISDKVLLDIMRGNIPYNEVYKHSLKAICIKQKAQTTDFGDSSIYDIFNRQIEGAVSSILSLIEEYKNILSEITWCLQEKKAQQKVKTFGKYVA